MDEGEYGRNDGSMTGHDRLMGAWVEVLMEAWVGVLKELWVEVSIESWWGY